MHKPVPNLAVKIVKERHANPEHARTRTPCAQTDVVPIVLTGAIDENLVLSLPRVVLKAAHLAVRQNFLNSVHAVESRVRPAVLAEKSEVVPNGLLVHFLHTGDIDRAVDLA